MSERFFVEPPITGEGVELSGPEAHHLTHVMRAKPGDEVVLFDGGGAEFVGRVEKVGKHLVTLAVVARKEIDREVARPIVLGVALPKGERQKWLVEKVTELGVTTLVPLLTRRGVAQPVETALARLRRSVIEASKQCERNRLMEIAEPASLAEFFASAPTDSRRWLAHPGGADVSRNSHSMNLADGEKPSPTYIAVGPEGGFADEEVAAAVAAGWTCVDLGPRILRVETAAILLAAWAL